MLSFCKKFLLRFILINRLILMILLLLDGLDVFSRSIPAVVIFYYFMVLQSHCL